MPPPTTPGLAIAGMVIGIIALVFFWVPLFGAVLAVLGMIFSTVGSSQAKRIGAPYGMGTAGAVCSFVSLMLMMVLVWITGNIIGCS